MSYRSWLKDVKHVRDLGSHVYGSNETWQVQERRDEQYFALRQEPLAQLGELWRYFYGAFHDAYIVSFEHVGSDFKIVLEDVTWVDEFFRTLSQIVGLDIKPATGFVTFWFQDVRYLTTLAARPDGVVRFSKYEQPGSEDCLYRDWWFSQDGRLQWVAQLDSFGVRRGLLNVGPFLVVDCEAVRVLDHRPSDIRRKYSTLVEQIWISYWQSLKAHDANQGVLSSRASLEDFLYEKGFTMNDLVRDLTEVRTQSAVP